MDQSPKAMPQSFLICRRVVDEGSFTHQNISFKRVSVIGFCPGLFLWNLWILFQYSFRLLRRKLLIWRRQSIHQNFFLWVFAPSPPHVHRKTSREIAIEKSHWWHVPKTIWHIWGGCGFEIKTMNYGTYRISTHMHSLHEIFNISKSYCQNTKARNNNLHWSTFGKNAVIIRSLAFGKNILSGLMDILWKVLGTPTRKNSLKTCWNSRKWMRNAD